MYLGALLAAGRVAPQLVDADPTLRGLLRIVPFGLPAEPPAPTPPPWQPLVGEQVILWSGGLWDWMDPLTLIRAMPQILAGTPQARLVFLAGQHPGTAMAMRMPDRARALAAELGLAEPQVTFVDRWLPYAERAGALLAATVAVYLHEASLESAYAAVRSRFLDHLWAGLPSVVSGGDAAAALVEQHRLGRVVAPGDAEGTAAALLALLGDAVERSGCADRARALAAEYRWERVAEPLIEFCHHPQMTTDHRTGVQLNAPTADGGPSVAALTGDRSVAIRGTAERDQRAPEQDALRNKALRALAASYRVSERPLPGGLIGRIRRALVEHVVRPFVAPLVEQQNAHNAAVLRALDALAENADVRRSDILALLDMQSGHLDAIDARLADLDDNDTMLAERIREAP
jgi:hypothetical protein